MTRVGASVALYAVFSLIAIGLGVSGKTLQNEYMLMWMVPLVSAIFVMPRTTFPPWPWPTGENDDDQAQIDMMRDQLRTLSTRTTITRLVYFALAIFFLALLPFLGI